MSNRRVKGQLKKLTAEQRLKKEIRNQRRNRAEGLERRTMRIPGSVKPAEPSRRHHA